MESIRRFIQDMDHTVKKTDVIDQFNKNIVSLNNEVLPMIGELEGFIKDNNLSLNDLKELSYLNKDTGIKANDIKGLINGISFALKTINDMSADFNSMLDKELPDLISRDSISIKEASILNLIANITNVVLFTSDFVIYVINLLDNKLTGKPLSYVKFKLMEIRNDMNKFGSLILFFRENKNLVKDMSKLSNDKIIIDSKDSGAISMLSSFKSKVKLVGFIGNPIYHVKMWLIDRQMNRYEVLKERKKVTELKILELRARQNGENDAKIQKAIEYHESKLENIEYKIRTIEEE